MDKYYLTSNIYYDLEKKCYISEENNENIKVNNANWKTLLSEYDIFNIPNIWNNRLSKIIDKIAIKDCGADGDCLFNVISDALNIHQMYDDSCFYHYSSDDIRTVAANLIDENNFDLLLNFYKSEQESDYFIDDWDPNEIESIKDLQNIIKTSGNTFWGDHIILELLQSKMQFNVIILKDDEDKIYPLANDINKYEHTIIIYYIDSIHFQLFTYFHDNKLITVFNKEYPIPNEILKIYKEDTNG